MFRTIIWFINFAFSLIFTIPGLIKLKYFSSSISAEERTAYIIKKTSNWARLQINMNGAKIHVIGAENVPKDGAVLFISNHQSDFDIPIFMSCIDKPKGFIAKIEIDKIPLLRTWMRHLRCVFMDRSSLRKSAEAIAEGIKILKSGYSLVIFPEGTRSKTGKIGEFKQGSFKLATKAKVPIVPVTLKNTRMLFEGCGYRMTPAEVEVIIHAPIETADLEKEEAALLPERVKAIIEESL